MHTCLRLKLRLVTGLFAAIIAVCSGPWNSIHADPETLADGAPIRTRLVSRDPYIQPGKTFWVGLVQEMKPGFHTYWRNPGTVGLATSITWELPEGFSAGEIHWPVPMVTKMAAYDVWGYEDRAFLAIPITAPADLNHSETDSIQIRASVQWMCCGDQCFPGFEDMALHLPVIGQNDSWPEPETIGHEEDFRKTLAVFPRMDSPWALTATFDPGSERVVIAGRWLHAHDGAYRISEGSRLQFFGYDRIVSSARGQNVSWTEQGFRLQAWLEEFTPTSDLSRLRGVLVCRQGKGKEKNAPTVYELDLPLETAEMD
jgi:thiol:disulfide interchange protein DsbD